MIGHIFKMVWNRKRSSILLIIEIVLASLVLFAAVAMAVIHLGRYRAPLGFAYDRLYQIDVDMKQSSDDYWSAEQTATVERLLTELEQLPEAEVVAGCFPPPFYEGGITSPILVKGEVEVVQIAEMTDKAPAALGLTLIQGRWFSPEDDALDGTAVLINRRARDCMFGSADPLGKPFHKGSRERIVGVFEEYRMQGDLVEPTSIKLTRVRLEPVAGRAGVPDSLAADDGDRPPRNFILRARPGTSAAFEEKVIRTLQTVAPEWSYRIEPTSSARQRQFMIRATPLLIVGLLAGFMIIMVVLGLTGVLWQNITRRTEELGIRRAMGGHRGAIYHQILGEVLLLTGVSILLASLILIQIPLLDLLASLPGNVFIMAWAVAMGLMLLMVTAAALYPAWIAARVPPAEALRYE